MMERNYDLLVDRYARVNANIEYLEQLRRFETKTYKENKDIIVNKLDELVKEANDILDTLGNIVNEKEPV